MLFVYRWAHAPALLLLLCVSLAPSPAHARVMALWQQRAELAAAYAAAINTLATQVDGKGDGAGTAELRAWLQVRRPDKIYLYHATSTAIGALDTSATDPTWRAEFATLRRDQADALFELAQHALRQREYSLSYELTLDALRENPDHQQARRILGYQRHDGYWRTTYAVRQLRVGQVETEEFGWLPKAFVDRYRQGQRRFQGRWMPADEERRRRSELGRPWRVTTEHYTIDTSHSLEAGVRLGRRLERLYNVWRRVFVQFYANEAELERMFAGRRARRGGDTSSARMRVVFYADRDQYQRALRGRSRRESRRRGFIGANSGRRFFFGSPEPDYRTLYHEATHQLFSESRPTVANVAAEANFWIVEGIACYMESLTEEDGFTTLGGCDDVRLQAARHRRLIDDYYVPLETLASYGMDRLQQDSNLPRLYSQASGLTHFLIHDQRGRYRAALVDYLRATYSGRDRPSTLAEVTGKPFAELDAEYRTFLEPQ